MSGRLSRITNWRKLQCGDNAEINYSLFTLGKAFIRIGRCARDRRERERKRLHTNCYRITCVSRQDSTQSACDDQIMFGPGIFMLVYFFAFLRCVVREIMNDFFSKTIFNSTLEFEQWTLRLRRMKEIFLKKHRNWNVFPQNVLFHCMLIGMFLWQIQIVGAFTTIWFENFNNKLALK